MKKIQYTLMMLVMTVMLSGCDTTWFDSLEGRWDLVSVVEYGSEYTVRDYETYVFQPDGWGYYVDNMGYTYEFYWEDSDYGSNRTVRLTYSDGLVDYMYYDFEHGDLLLSYDRNFRSYRVFSYRGHHY